MRQFQLEDELGGGVFVFCNKVGVGKGSTASSATIRLRLANAQEEGVPTWRQRAVSPDPARR
jgi:hypothetical protein